MACLGTHLAIALKYLENHKGKENEKRFMEGCLAPDIKFNDGIKSHYGKRTKFKTYKLIYGNKVDIFKFLEKNKLKTSYKRGYFLHLITDIVFYNYIYSKKMANLIAYEEINKRMYSNYNFHTADLIKDYRLPIIPEYAPFVGLKNGYPYFYTKKKLYNFINTFCKVDIDKIFKLIKKKKRIPTFTDIKIRCDI